jgi:hypothetical protein
LCVVGDTDLGNWPFSADEATAALSSDWSRKRAVRGTAVVITSLA